MVGQLRAGDSQGQPWGGQWEDVVPNQPRERITDKHLWPELAIRSLV